MPALDRVNDILADHRCPAHRPPNIDATGLEGARVGVTDIMGDLVACKRRRIRKLRELIAIAVIKSRKVIPTVSLGVTCAVVDTYGCDDGRIAPTRCAIIAAGLDGR